MQFFDLNIPYLEGEKSIPDKQSRKQNRLKTIVKAMELGYTGIAYNRTIEGSSMSESSDRCTIPPFPLSSLLNISPSLSSTVAFHRRLLGVPETTSFRQYTRLTVVVDTSAHCLSLNSGNPVLKSYDFVAVRPLNQNTFDLSCQSSQVDLISIEFGEKLPFRLKLPMVKAAIARGVYFEITYSTLMKDAQVRRQTISNAKLLVEWTQGKNLIVSSAAPSVLGLRGPNDVANLLSLLGLSDERAKASISKNCRLLIANALRKKHFYKEAIRVEVMPEGTQIDPKKPWIVDCLNWDPLSSGEGDLLLEDMAKSFAKSGKVSETVKAIDFASIVNSAPTHGLQVKDISCRAENKSHPTVTIRDTIFASEDLEASKDVQKVNMSLHGSLLDEQSNADEKSHLGMLSNDSDACPVAEGIGASSIAVVQELEKSNSLDRKISVARSREGDLQGLVLAQSQDLFVSNNIITETPSGDVVLDVGCSACPKEVPARSKDLDCPCVEVPGALKRAEAGVLTEMQLGDRSDLSLSTGLSTSGHVLQLVEDPVHDTDSTIHAHQMMDVDQFASTNSTKGLLLGDVQQLGEVAEEKEQGEDHSKDAKECILADSMIQVDSLSESNYDGDVLVAKSALLEDMIVESDKRTQDFDKAEIQPVGEKKSGNHKVKRLTSRQCFRFPFKRLFQAQFKRKRRISMYTSKNRT